MLPFSEIIKQTSNLTLAVLFATKQIGIPPLQTCKKGVF